MGIITWSVGRSFSMTNTQMQGHLLTFQFLFQGLRAQGTPIMKTDVAKEAMHDFRPEVSLRTL